MRSSAEYGVALTPGWSHRRAVAAGLITAGLGVFAAPAFAQSTPQPAPRTASSLDPSAPAPDLGEEARLLANLFTRMAVKTDINGHPGFAFVMDTGASRTAITRDIADALGLPPGPPIMVHGLTSAELTPTVKIARLSFGGRRFNDIYAGIYPREHLGADGLLGLDVLSRFELEFDIDRRLMTLTPSGFDRIEMSAALHTPTHIRRDSSGRTRTGRFGQLILVNARVEGVQVDCFIDSGAQYSIGNMALFEAVASGGDRPSQRTLIPVYGVTGQTVLAEVAVVSQISIGARRLGPSSLLFADLHAFEILELNQRPALLLGADTLSRFRWVSIDFGRSRMDFGAVRRTSETMTRR